MWTLDYRRASVEEGIQAKRLQSEVTGLQRVAMDTERRGENKGDWMC